MVIQVIFLIVGFILLIKGADVFVDASSNTARILKVSSLIIGLTIVAFGTSMPEFAVSMKAMASGSGDIVLGNVIGSSIANILLILGVSSLFCKLKVSDNTIKKEIPIMILISTLFSVLLLDSIFNKSSINILSRQDGIVILLFFIIFIYYLFTLIKTSNLNKKDEVVEKSKNSLIKSLLLIVVGLICVIIGSNLVVESAVKIAAMLNVSEKVISFTIVALGTSLPELVTSIISARKGKQGLLIGNIIGSNIFNIGIVLAVPTVIFGNINAVGFNYVDLMMLVLSSIILYLFAKHERFISKFEGIVLILLFVVYYTYLILI